MTPKVNVQAAPCPLGTPPKRLKVSKFHLAPAYTCRAGRFSGKKLPLQVSIGKELKIFRKIVAAGAATTRRLWRLKVSCFAFFRRKLLEVLLGDFGLLFNASSSYPLDLIYGNWERLAEIN